MAWCKKSHRKDPKFKNLKFSEEFFGEPERWKCAGCAYDQGFNDAKAGLPNNPRLNELDQSQASAVRHRSPIEGYNMGYNDGLKP
ncbi:hypothetical protein [Chryseobacterium sp.]|uniref:hypothetical protein n=1 Tax=Chryseobacterium sp. TaxID=1871047 RepID=UPI000ECC1E21|nr:hypothetical protein [Chryseobacterium sp.]HCM34201.1 hypothetical protein [Chryseobacterium sp.]